MFSKKLIFIMTIVTILTLLPLSVLAASKSDGSITLNYPDPGICDPNAVLTTTGVPGDGYVMYRFYYAVDGTPVYPFPWQQMAGNLSVKYPYDLVPEGITEFAIVVAAYDSSGAVLGKLQVKWDCTPPPPPPDGEGCTPGYWKNHLDAWEIDPGTLFSDYFGAGPEITLQAAVNLEGGFENALARHTTAGALNLASGLDYGFTQAELFALVQGAFSSGDYESAKDQIEAFNETYCPLD